MTYNHTIKPEVINILGNSQRTPMSTRSSNVQVEVTHTQSLWDRIKPKIKKVIGLIKRVVTYVKVEIVPIAIAAAGVMNAWSNYQRCTGNARYSACYA